MIIEQMAAELGLPVHFILSLARTASHEYKAYQIPKRTGGFRLIHHPSKRLKALQRWLLSNVIEGLLLHPAAMAYRRNVSIFDNAKMHASSRYLLRMDLKNFFPSITQSDIVNYVLGRRSQFAGWSPSDIVAFSGLVCRKSVLTIGAPTSPALSNALCFELDQQLQALSDKSKVIYTRYADDLFFSTQQRDVLHELETKVSTIVSDLTLPANLKLNAGKTRHSSKRGARRVTGVILGSDGNPHIGRKFKRKVRALVHTLDALDESMRASLAGMIAYAAGLTLIS